MALGDGVLAGQSFSLQALNSIPRPLVAALLAALFVLALGVGFAASSAGEEEQPVKRVGSEAVPLDVPAAGAETPGLAEADALPAMARRPEPPPKPEPEPEPEVETFPEEPVDPEPVAPAVPEPAPEPAPPPAPPPPVEFDDEG